MTGDRRDRRYLFEGARLVQPARLADGVYMSLQHPAVERLFAFDLGLPEGTYQIGETPMRVVVRDGRANIYADAPAPVPAQYSPNGLAFFFAQGTQPLQGFARVTGSGASLALQGMGGTFPLVRVPEPDR